MTTNEVSKICKALGDENRIHIVMLLAKGELCACQILEDLRISQPTLSHHMRVLTDCGLVKARKETTWMHYSLECERFKEFKSFIDSLSCSNEKSTCHC